MQDEALEQEAAPTPEDEALARLRRAAQDGVALLQAQGAAILLERPDGALRLSAKAGAPGAAADLRAPAAAALAAGPLRPQRAPADEGLFACAFESGGLRGALLVRIAPDLASGSMGARLRFLTEGLSDGLGLAHAAQALEDARRALMERSDELNFTAQMADLGVWSYDVAQDRMHVSAGLFEMLDEDGDARLTRESVAGYLVDADGDGPELKEAFDKALSAAAPFDLELRIKTAAGIEKWIRLIGRPVSERGRVTTLRGCAQDVTEQVLTREDITLLATRDYLTEVANRASFTNLFETAIKACDFSVNALVLFIIDVDHFKNINDSFGHDVGDHVLREVTQILYSAVRETDVVGRLGGDEFGVFVVGPRASGRDGRRLGDEVAERIQTLVAERASLRGLGGGVTLSIGYADAEGPDASFKTTLKSADLALYDAKRAGRNRAIRYRSALGSEYEQRERVLLEVDKALKAHQLEPYYQPKLALSTGALAGFEALARWRHPERGVLSPGAFAEALADVRLSTRISEHMLRQAISHAAQLRREGLAFGRIGVNVTEKQIVDPAFADRLERMAEEAGVSCSDFDVEITEAVLLARNADEIRSTLGKLRALNVTLSLDDFGTGYASLTHLRAFPIDQIKIDKSFIIDIETNRESRIITNAVIRMAHDLQLSIIAEGVETLGAEEILRDMGCDQAQGWLYSKAIPFDAAATFCASAHAAAPRRAGSAQAQA